MTNTAIDTMIDTMMDTFFKSVDSNSYIIYIVSKFTDNKVDSLSEIADYYDTITSDNILYVTTIETCEEEICLIENKSVSFHDKYFNIDTKVRRKIEDMYKESDKDSKIKIWTDLMNICKAPLVTKSMNECI